MTATLPTLFIFVHSTFNYTMCENLHAETQYN